MVPRISQLNAFVPGADQRGIGSGVQWGELGLTSFMASGSVSSAGDIRFRDALERSP
jgi:hypothetical protein